jgi:hypothetical protein
MNLNNMAITDGTGFQRKGIKITKRKIEAQRYAINQKTFEAQRDRNKEKKVLSTRYRD